MMIFCNRSLENLEVNKDQGDDVSVCLKTTYLVETEFFFAESIVDKVKRYLK